MTGDEEKVRKDRDPILAVCFVVFILATCAVTGAFVYDKYIATDDTLANNGSKVVVDYTGTYYNYYGENKAVVFDTTYASIGENDTIVKANDFNKTTFSSLSFTIGSGSYLAGFENAIVGHKAGDTVKVMIPANSAYVVADTSKIIDCSTTQTVNVSEKMTVSQFNAAYPDLTATGNNSFTSLYGWNAVSSYDSATNSVLIQYMPEVSGKPYYAYDGEFGKVGLRVTAVSSSTISFEYVISDFVQVSTAVGTIEIQMIKVNFGTSSFYITSVTDADSNGYADTFNCKTSGEKYNEDLYFEITIVSVA